jgi:hypothetical protein
VRLASEAFRYGSVQARLLANVQSVLEDAHNDLPDSQRSTISPILQLSKAALVDFLVFSLALGSMFCVPRLYLLPVARFRLPVI